MSVVNNLPLYILNTIFDSDVLGERVTKLAFVAVHRNTNTPDDVQYLIDNRTIPKLFLCMRHPIKSVQILIAETLAKVFRSATEVQIASILEQTDAFILSYFHKILVLGHAHAIKDIFRPVCAMLLTVMRAIVSPKFCDLPNSKNLLFDSEMCSTLRFIILHSYDNWSMEDFPRRTVADIMKFALPAAKIGLTGSKNSVLCSVDIIFELLPLMYLASQFNVFDKCISFLIPLKPVLEMIFEEGGDTEENITIVGTIVRMMKNFALFEESGVDLLVKAKMIPIIIRLLDFKDLETDAIVLVYDIISCGSTKHIQACMDAGLLEKIPALLGVHAYELTRKVVINTLSAILLDGNQSQYEIVTHPDFVPGYLPVVLERGLKRYDFLSPVSKRLLQLLPESIVGMHMKHKINKQISSHPSSPKQTT